MRRIHAALTALAVAFAPVPGFAQGTGGSPLAANHPLVGTWRIDLPQARCHELYQLKADGTTQVTSGEQSAESQVELSAQPSPKGFYKWVDRITRHNGKPDCMGETMEVGHVTTLYVVLHPTGDRFLMCRDEDFDTCIGPFVKQPGI